MVEEGCGVREDVEAGMDARCPVAGV